MDDKIRVTVSVDGHGGGALEDTGHTIEFQDDHDSDGSVARVWCRTWPLPDELWVSADLVRDADPRFLTIEHEQRADGYHYRATITTENVDAVYEAGPQINGILMFTRQILAMRLVSATRKEV